jgi:hypothetical protein
MTGRKFVPSVKNATPLACKKKILAASPEEQVC